MQVQAQSGYRWAIVGASALILAIAMGAMVNGMSAFIVPMQDQFGWARGDITLINFAGIMGLAFGGIFMGPQADKRGARPVVVFGAIVLGLCYVVAAFCTSLWQLYAVFFIAGFFGAGAIYAPILATVGTWFFTGAGLAIGIASAGQALGQGGVPFISSVLIKELGISGAFGAIGAFMLATMVPLSLFLRPPPALGREQKAASDAQDAGLLPTRTVVITMCIAIILCCTCMSVPLMHLVPLIQDRGFDPDEAGSVIFVMLLAGILGRVSFGKLADLIGALPAYMLATAWMTLLVFGFMYIETLRGFYIYAAIYGFGYAGVMTGILVSIRVLTPVAKRAAAFGIVTMFGWFGHAIGGYMGGALYDYTGDYTAAYAMAALAGVLNLIVVSTLLRKTRRIPPRLVAA